MTQVVPTVVHHLLFAGFEDDESGLTGVAGNCTCSAWFDMRVNENGELVALITYNNYPPCPAVMPLTSHFKKETL